MKVKVGIIGGAGYTAGELLRILLNHLAVEVTMVQSDSNAGKKISSIHKGLFQSDLVFSSDIDSEVFDVVFFCKGHGESRKVIDGNPELLEKQIIDLSQDYRLDGLHDFVYGLPEVNKDQIAASKHIANPGCFATSIQLGLLPAFQSGSILGDVHTSGITGSTGAGQAFSETSHFSWRNSNASVYKPLTHQHLLESNETFSKVNGSLTSSIHFIPYRGAFTRGIITTSYFKTDLQESQLISLYEKFYQDHPFTYVSSENPDLKMVVNTNHAIVYPKVIDGQAVIISVIDNLLKGASGQAVQNMNLICGLSETDGLQLKATSF